VAEDHGALPVLVGVDGTAVGVIELSDDLRAGWDSVLSELAADGLRIVVLSGDDSKRLGVFEDHPAVSEVFGGVPPEGKAETVARLAAEGTTVMVGDGSNDAPALARADLGIALGSGTALAVDAADVAIIDDNLSSLIPILRLAEATGRRIKENLGWAFCYNAIAIPVAIMGLLNPLFAAVAMALSSILVVTNSSRSLLPESDNGDTVE
jgi:Cu2+-exporting ATPase